MKHYFLKRTTVFLLLARCGYQRRFTFSVKIVKKHLCLFALPLGCIILCVIRFYYLRWSSFNKDKNTKQNKTEEQKLQHKESAYATFTCTFQLCAPKSRFRQSRFMVQGTSGKHNGRLPRSFLSREPGTEQRGFRLKICKLTMKNRQ